MTKIYILTGYGINTTKAYATRELAEKACERENYELSMSGSNNRAYVKELDLAEEEEDEEE